jgi:hypothetical protein
MRTSAVTISSPGGKRIEKFLPPLLCCALAGLAGWNFLQALSGDTVGIFREFYIVPWTLLVLFVLVIPLIYLLATGRFSLFHPLVYPVWSYLFPAFVLGSLYLAISAYEPHFIGLIPDRENNIPLALIYVAVGFAGLTVGYSLRSGRRLGEGLSRRLPAWNWESDRVIVPCLILVAAGRFFELKALASGATGYQSTDQTLFGNTFYSLAILSSMANIILWIVIFKAPRFRLRHYLVLTFLIGLIPYSMMIAGGKGELLRNVIAIVFAYWSAGRRFTVGKGIIAGALLVFAIFAGFTYGTTFRQLKGDESRIEVADYFELGASALSMIGDMDILDNAGFVIENTLTRFETLTSLSVVVANYKALRPLEGDYGIEENIWTDTWTALFPRFIWSGKPAISNARTYSELYFNSGDTSYAITPFGDLLRNFGPIGVPLGMAFLGLILRVLYTGLMECKERTVWKLTCYFVMLSHVSYEGFYGGIFPVLLRVGVILFLGGILINVMASFRIFDISIKDER